MAYQSCQNIVPLRRLHDEGYVHNRNEQQGKFHMHCPKYLGNIMIYIYIFIYLYICVYIYIYLPIYLPTHLSIYPSIHLSIYLPIYPLFYMLSITAITQGTTRLQHVWRGFSIYFFVVSLEVENSRQLSTISTSHCFIGTNVWIGLVVSWREGWTEMSLLVTPLEIQFQHVSTSFKHV